MIQTTSRRPCFTHPIVRAMHWVLHSGPLLTHLPHSHDGLLGCSLASFLGESDDHLLQKLLAMEAAPEHLEAWIARRPTRRVGHFFENLVHYWLAYQSSAELIACNEQISNKERTLGELDFLFRYEGSLIHLETTIKYYLQAPKVSHEPEVPQWSRLVGPNGHDTLTRKTSHLAHKQLPFGRDPSIKRKFGLRDPVLSKALFRGTIFYPANGTPEPIAGLDPNHPRGFWACFDELSLPELSPDVRWLIIDKPEWIGPLCLPPETREDIPHNAITMGINTHFLNSSAALLVVGFRKEANSRPWREVQRGILVAPGWPHSVKPLRDTQQGSKSGTNY